MVYVGLGLVVLIGAILAAVIVRSRHLKLRTTGDSLLLESGVVVSTLNPAGAILVRGELFFAKSHLGDVIPPSTSVRVIGVNDHLLLVVVQ